MTNIKQRAQELLTCDELRGRLPDEVQAFLRDVVALEPVGHIWPSAVQVLKAQERKYEILWGKPTGQAGMPLYDLGAPNDPRVKPKRSRP